jgi:hypothetical protein
MRRKERSWNGIVERGKEMGRGKRKERKKKGRREEWKRR